MPGMSEKAQKSGAKKFVRKPKAARQREIVEATVDLIGKYGWQGTTVSRIAQAAGISRGALYQHFPDREAVLEAALDLWHERSSGWMAVSTNPDAAQRLLEIGEAHSSWALSEYNTFVRPFFQLIASNRQTSLSRTITRHQQKDFRYLIGLVDEGKRQGGIHPDVDSGDVAWSLFLHAWGEDIARMMGVDQFISEGASNRIFERLLATYSTGTRTGREG